MPELPAGTGIRDEVQPVRRSVRPSRWRNSLGRAALFAVLSLTLVVCAHPALALSPESPEVVAAVNRGLQYLETHDEPRSGGKALIALAFLKNGQEDHPYIQQALESVQSTIKKDYSEDVYTNGLSIIFLITLDPVKYRTEIDALLGFMIARQKPHGGWGYDHQASGDTSMTQYAVLSMWEAGAVGIETPVASWERVSNWLLRTQDPSGAFGYQGRDSGSFTRVPQAEVRHSMAAAGLGSLYVCTDHLGLSNTPQQESNVPTALQVVQDEQTKKRRLTNNVDTGRVQLAASDGAEWFVKNHDMDAKPYTHYYLYAYERYRSFREVAENSVEIEPAWYDEAATFLLQTQREDGSWLSSGTTGPECDTAFAVLFLLRSTKKSLNHAGRFGAGTLVGGRGLPTGDGPVQMRGGRVIAKPLAGPAEELLKLIEDPNREDHDQAVQGFEDLARMGNEELLTEHEAKIKELAAKGDPDARRAAVVALGRTGNLDNVPILIYALTDPDERVFLAARDSLRFISRRFDVFESEGVLSADRLRAEIERWKQWYRRIRPDAVFED